MPAVKASRIESVTSMPIMIYLQVIPQQRSLCLAVFKREMPFIVLENGEISLCDMRMQVSPSQLRR